METFQFFCINLEYNVKILQKNCYQIRHKKIFAKKLKKSQKNRKIVLTKAKLDDIIIEYLARDKNI